MAWGLGLRLLLRALAFLSWGFTSRALSLQVGSKRFCSRDLKVGVCCQVLGFRIVACRAFGFWAAGLRLQMFQDRRVQILRFEGWRLYA